MKRSHRWPYIAAPVLRFNYLGSTNRCLIAMTDQSSKRRKSPLRPPFRLRWIYVDAIRSIRNLAIAHWAPNRFDGMRAANGIPPRGYKRPRTIARQRQKDLVGVVHRWRKWTSAWLFNHFTISEFSLSWRRLKSFHQFLFASIFPTELVFDLRLAWTNWKGKTRDLLGCFPFGTWFNLCPPGQVKMVNVDVMNVALQKNNTHTLVLHHYTWLVSASYKGKICRRDLELMAT